MKTEVMANGQVLTFEEDTHTYDLDGRFLISTTTLMKKLGLTPDYKNVDLTTLNAKASYGTMVHKELEELLTENKYGISDEVYLAKTEIEKRGLQLLGSEMLVCNNIVAGQIDYLCKDQDNNIILIDFKTTASYHDEAVSWQESIYADLLLTSKDIRVDKLECWHFHKNEDGKIILDVNDVMFKSEEDIKACYMAYATGTSLVLKKGDFNPERAYTLETYINNLENELNAKKQEYEAFKEELLKQMDKRGLSKFETDDVVIQISSRKDSTRITKSISEDFKKNDPELYEKYITEKESVTKGYRKLTIKIKEHENE